MKTSQEIIEFLATPAMTDDEAAVWVELRSRRGADQAIKVPTLAERVGMSTRKLQSVVRSLILEHRKPIGVSMRPPYGNYHAVTSEERQAASKLHRSRALAELETAAAIMGIDRAEYVRRYQTELLGDEAA